MGKPCNLVITKEYAKKKKIIKNAYRVCRPPVKLHNPYPSNDQLTRRTPLVLK